MTPIARYLFGPESNPPIESDTVRAEVDRLGGIVVPGDIMRITGLGRSESEALLCRLAAQHGGDVGVAGTAVLYRFPKRMSGLPRLISGRLPSAIWDRRLLPEPVTGNVPSTDFLLLLANLLVLAASSVAILLTLPTGAWLPSLGVFTFALALFALSLPSWRVLNRRSQVVQAAVENGRRGLLRMVLQRRLGSWLSAHALSHAWVAASGCTVSARRLRQEVMAIGGEPDLDESGRLYFRFPDLDHESRALDELRRR